MAKIWRSAASVMVLVMVIGLWLGEAQATANDYFQSAQLAKMVAQELSRKTPSETFKANLRDSLKAPNDQQFLAEVMRAWPVVKGATFMATSAELHVVYPSARMILELKSQNPLVVRLNHKIDLTIDPDHIYDSLQKQMLPGKHASSGQELQWLPSANAEPPTGWPSPAMTPTFLFASAAKANKIKETFADDELAPPRTMGSVRCELNKNQVTGRLLLAAPDGNSAVPIEFKLSYDADNYTVDLKKGDRTFNSELPNSMNCADVISMNDMDPPRKGEAGQVRGFEVSIYPQPLGGPCAVTVSKPNLRAAKGLVQFLAATCQDSTSTKDTPGFAALCTCTANPERPPEVVPDGPPQDSGTALWRSLQRLGKQVKVLDLKAAAREVCSQKNYQLVLNRPLMFSEDGKEAEETLDFEDLFPEFRQDLDAKSTQLDNLVKKVKSKYRAYGPVICYNGACEMADCDHKPCNAKIKEEWAAAKVTSDQLNRGEMKLTNDPLQGEVKRADARYQEELKRFGAAERDFNNQMSSLPALVACCQDKKCEATLRKAPVKPAAPAKATR